MTENTKNTNNTFQKEEESSLRLADIWGLVWDHKWWYVLCLAACICVAAFYLYRTPSTYSSTAKVLIDESNQDATMRNLGVASAGMMRLRSFNSVENEIEAFASLDLMQKVVERLGLQTTYTAHERFRTINLATNSPVRMVLAGENPHTSFSYDLKNLGDNRISLSNFMINGQAAGSPVEGVLGDTLQTPAGALAIFLTEHADEFNQPIAVAWQNSVAAAKKYCGRLDVSLSGKESSVVVLKMTDTDPRRASDVISTLIEVYDEVWINNKNRAAINTTKFINERLAVIERDLSVVEEALKQYKASNNLTADMLGYKLRCLFCGISAVIKNPCLYKLACFKSCCNLRAGFLCNTALAYLEDSVKL